MYMNRILGFSILGFILLVAFYSNANYFVFAHTFSGDESASFLTTAEMMKIESQLAQKDLASNTTTAKEHAQHTTELIKANDTKEIDERNPRLATELNTTLSDFVKTFDSGKPSESTVKDKAGNLDDVMAEVVSARIDKQQLDNVTVKSLVVNNLVGETLEHYNSSLGMSEASHVFNKVGVFLLSIDILDNLATGGFNGSNRNLVFDFPITVSEPVSVELTSLTLPITVATIAIGSIIALVLLKRSKRSSKLI